MRSGSRRFAIWLAVLVALSVLAAALPATAAGTFTDDDGSVFEADIEYLFALGVTKGCTTTTFCPEDPVTRAEMAAFFVRLFGYPPSTTAYFTDDNGHFFEPEIDAFRQAGVTTGCTSTTKFCPDDNVTREQMAAFFSRALGLHKFTTPLFTDVTGGIFHGDINAIRGVGITLGCTTTTYCPRKSVTRGEMSSFLARAHRLGTKRAPAVDMTSPANLAVYATSYNAGLGLYSAFVTLATTAVDPNGGTPTYTWRSTVHGSFGTGQAKIVDIWIPAGLDSSQPLLIVRATDSDGLFTEDMAQIKLVLPSP